MGAGTQEARGVSWESTKEDGRICLPVREMDILFSEGEKESGVYCTRKIQKMTSGTNFTLKMYLYYFNKKGNNCLNSTKNSGHSMNKGRR